MEKDRDTNKNGEIFSVEEQSLSHGEYLAGLGKWSKIVIGAALVGGALLVFGRDAEASVGEPQLMPDRDALIQLAAWANRAGGGSVGWVNRYGGGGSWVNRGGGGWVNRYGGGGAWANHGGSVGWVNRYGGGGAWVNRGGGGSWINRY